LLQTGADWDQKAFAAIGFIKDLLLKKPHINFTEKASISLKKSSKIIEIFIKAPNL
jgi:hypothetical protein